MPDGLVKTAWVTQDAHRSGLSWSARARRRGAGQKIFNELRPPMDASDEELLLWAYEAQRRASLIMLACWDAKQAGSDSFKHPITGQPSDRVYFLDSAQHRHRVAGQYITTLVTKRFGPPAAS